MSFYKCTECNTFFTQKWPLLKGHLKNHHHHTDLDEAKVEDLVKYESPNKNTSPPRARTKKGLLSTMERKIGNHPRLHPLVTRTPHQLEAPTLRYQKKLRNMSMNPSNVFDRS